MGWTGPPARSGPTHFHSCGPPTTSRQVAGGWRGVRPTNGAERKPQQPRPRYDLSSEKEAAAAARRRGRGSPPPAADEEEEGGRRGEGEGEGDGVQGGGRLRLPVQGGADRGLGGGQVQPAHPLHPQRVQPRVQVHHRRRVRHPQHPRRRQGRQGPDLGHRRSGEVPGDHERVLPRGGRRPGRLRRHEARHLRERREVAEGAQGPHGRQHRDHARGEQGGPAPPQGRPVRGRQGLRRAGEHLLHGDVRPGGHERRGRLHRGALPDLPRGEQEGPRHRGRPRRAPQGQDHQRRLQGRRVRGEEIQLLFVLAQDGGILYCRGGHYVIAVIVLVCIHAPSTIPVFILPCLIHLIRSGLQLLLV